jgi:hypothetical protein
MPQDVLWGFFSSISILVVGVELMGLSIPLDWRGVLMVRGLTSVFGAVEEGSTPTGGARRNISLGG